MASSLASLKELPCPAGDNCSAFQCLFKHERDGAKQGPIDIVRRPRPVKQDATSEDSEGPRKRPKLSQSTSPVSLHNTTLSGLEGHGKSTRGDILSKRGRVDVSTSKITPAKRPISPPPLKRDVQSSSKQAERSDASLTQTERQTSTTQATSSTSVSTTKSPVPAKSPTKTAPKKPETLNPRLLKRSPAQHETRLKLLKALHGEYTRLNNELKKDPNNKGSKLVLSDQELVVRALDEEQETATKKPEVYPNSMKHRIFTYKRMSIAQWKEERTKALQEASTQAGEGKPDPSSHIITGLTAAQEVEFVKRLVRHLDGLEPFGYVTSMPSEEDIRGVREAVEASGNTEACDRCTRRFQVFPGRREEDGALATNGTCTYHPGKVYYPERPPGDRSQGQRKYRCCHQNVEDRESAGCTTSDTHVFKTTDPKRLASILNFAKTPANPGVPADRAIAFDCEMGYTVYGLELIRLTAVGWPNGEELLDVLVQPIGETLNLNTRYSGVRPEDMVNADRWKPGDDPKPAIIPSPDPSQPPKRKLKLVPSPKAARDLLFSLMNPDTPLIGHGTENDLNAVRIIHPTVVDTVLLYPHKRGLPVRNGLKYLTEAHLGRKIQLDLADEDGVPEGHDSAEDARAAGELVRLKVRDEWRKMQLKGWTLSDKGEFLAPGEDGRTYVGAGKKTGS
ncbi:hypothetical protein DL762_002566 [Monosporascus cannonballus]|uniref:Exonuclease domain-containing protein n=1 Tax=Monosporascus cannonballus TaxID=155416 RepID=A0ABY0HEH3_9PEZI|nr:hypothetical protein DL762_002566 [Monosporascus cannonballus]